MGAQEIRENANNSAWIDATAKTQTGPGKPGLAVAVIKNGRIVQSRRLRHRESRDRRPGHLGAMFHIGSCGKLLAALAIMMLKEGGS